MPGHEDLGAVAEEQPAPHGHSARLDVVDLLEEDLGVDDDAVTDDAGFIGVEDAGGDEVQLELAQLVDDGVPGVVGGGVPGDDLGLLRQQVYHSALTFVPPLAAYDHDRWHKIIRLRRTPFLPVSPQGV